MTGCESGDFVTNRRSQSSASIREISGAWKSAEELFNVERVHQSILCNTQKRCIVFRAVCGGTHPGRLQGLRGEYKMDDYVKPLVSMTAVAT